MLTKLLKYEFRATARLFLPLYLALIVFALINRFISPFKMLESTTFYFDVQAIISILAIAAYFALIIGVIVMTILIMIQRFYKSLLGDEGYLMFTLPVHPWQHIVSKLIVAMVWTTASFFVTMGSILIISGSGVAQLWGPLMEAMNAFRAYFGAAGFFLLPFAVLVSLVSSILMIYAAIALGHLFFRQKLLASFAMYCALYVVSQAITLIILMPLGIAFYQFLGEVTEPTAFELNLVILTLLLPSLILVIGYFILTNIILKKKLNLE